MQAIPSEGPKGLVFLWRDEKLITVLTFFAAAFVFAELLGALNPGLQNNRRMIGTVVGLLALEGLHVVVTFLGLLFVPELKNWINLKSNGQVGWFWGKASLLGAVLFSIFFFVGNEFQKPPNTSVTVVQIMVVIVALLSLHHRMSQSFGILKAYNQAERSELGSSPNLLNLSERYGFMFLFCLCCFLYALRFEVVRRQLLSSIPALDVSLVSIILLTAALAVSCVLSVTVFVSGRGRRICWNYRQKTLHAARTALFPMAPFSIVSAMVVEALHGLEYIFVWRKMSSNLREKRWWLRRPIWTLALIAMYYFIVNMTFHYKLSSSDVSFFWSRVLSSLYLAVTLTHFYLDRILFRMRDPETRQLIGPLLVSSIKNPLA